MSKKFSIAITIIVSTIVSLFSATAFAATEWNIYGATMRQDGVYVCDQTESSDQKVKDCAVSIAVRDEAALAGCVTDQTVARLTHQHGNAMTSVTEMWCQGKKPRHQIKFTPVGAGIITYTFSLAGASTESIKTFMIMPQTAPLTAITGVTRPEGDVMKEDIEENKKRLSNSYVVMGGYVPVLSRKDSHCGTVSFMGSPWRSDEVRGEFGGQFAYCDTTVPANHLYLLNEHDRMRQGQITADANLVVPMGTKYLQFVLGVGFGVGYMAVDKDSAGQFDDGTLLTSDTGSFVSPILMAQIGLRLMVGPFALQAGAQAQGQSEPQGHRQKSDRQFRGWIGPSLGAGINF